MLKTYIKHKIFAIFRAARHGFKLSGKLKRIEQQEKAGRSSEPVETKLKKRKRKQRERLDEEISNECGSCDEAKISREELKTNSEISYESESCDKEKIRRKKLKKNNPEVASTSVHLEHDDNTPDDVSTVRKKRKTNLELSSNSISCGETDAVVECNRSDVYVKKKKKSRR